ncbi:MAG: hypothetical protein ACI9KE_004674 [Polyangiales bacterium]|jgi:hypothetical protein
MVLHIKIGDSVHGVKGLTWTAETRVHVLGASPLVRSMRIVLSTLLLLTLGSAVSEAQLSAPELEEAHQRLRTFDFADPSGVELLSDLGVYLRTNVAATESHRREASFLRYVVATDMLLISRWRQTGLEGAIARAMDVDEGELVESLKAGLAPLTAGVYSQTANDALYALNESQEVRGPRSALGYFAAVAEAASAHDPIARLARLSDDVCADGGECPAPFHYFRADGRRAIATVQAALGRLASFQREAHSEDPFVLALGDAFANYQELFQQIQLAPEARLGEITLSAAGPREADVLVESLIVIRPEEVCVGTIARVRFREGHAEAYSDSAGIPLLPETLCVPVPQSLRPFPTPMPELVTALAPLANCEHLGVGGSDDAPAHLLTRVWLSALSAGVTPHALVGRGEDGHLAALRAVAVRGEDGSAIQVHIRLGGHTIAVRGSGERSLPRRPGPDGWSFDYDTLETFARDSRTTSVRYMHSLPLGSLTATAFYIAPRESHVTLVMP